MGNPTPSNLNPLAQQANQAIEAAAPEIMTMLSDLGRRLFFPKGILSQTAEARGKKYNATIGLATEGDGPMYLPSIYEKVSGVKPADIFSYAPPAGRPSIREKWREKMLLENPSLKGKTFGLPLATNAITHGLSLVGELFVDPGDVIVLPNHLWGNYRMTYEVKLGGVLKTYNFYQGSGFDTGALAQAVAEHARGREKLIVLLNFPNNPTGYMPTPAEGDAIASILEKQARAGTKIVAWCDDAYFGLFYHLGGQSMTESMFGRLTNLHPNLLAVKLDGATKELFVWGFRCGFITYGPGRAEGAEPVLEALDAKTRGAIRGGISNSPLISQTLVEAALSSPTVAEERKQKYEILRARAEKVYQVCRDERYRDSWEMYPFNSGYFMCIKVKGVDAEKLRKHLLEKHEVGVIATSAQDIRIAFSSLDIEGVQPVFEAIHRSIQDLRK
jgi:aspartate/methionine/tyrosine aminotransferase